MADRTVPRAPTGMKAAGRKLWQAIHRALPDDCELDEREGAILAMACRQADDVAELEFSLTEHGRVVDGSRGQPRLSQAVTEARQGRLAVARLLGELDLTADEPRTSRSKQAQKAANVRWAQRDMLAARRSGQGA